MIIRGKQLPEQATSTGAQNMLQQLLALPLFIGLLCSWLVKSSLHTNDYAPFVLREHVILITWKQRRRRAAVPGLPCSTATQAQSRARLPPSGSIANDWCRRCSCCLYSTPATTSSPPSAAVVPSVDTDGCLSVADPVAVADVDGALVTCA